MSTSPFMDDYSSEDYSNHDGDYYFVPTPTSPPQVRAQVEIQTQSNELQNVIIDLQEGVSESVYFDVLPELEAEIQGEERGEMEQSIYLAVESYFDLEAQAENVAADLEAHAETGITAVLESQAEIGVAFVLEAETAVEQLAVGSYFDLEAQVETGLPVALDTESILEEGDGIESESLETLEADIVVESMIEEFIYEAVESESDLEAENAIEEPKSDVEHEVDAVAPEAETAVGEEDVIEELPETVAAYAALNPNLAVEGDVIGIPFHEAMESDYDLEAEDMVEDAEDLVEEEEDLVEEKVDVIVEEEDVDMVEEDDDTVEGEAAMEESIYKHLKSNSDFQGEEPEALVEPAVSIEMINFTAQEPDFDLEPEEPEDLIDEQSDSCEEERESDVEESDLNEKKWESDAEETDMDPEDSDMDFSDSDFTEEEEDDVVVSYLKSSTTIRNKASWKSLVPASALAWAKLPVTDTTTLEDSSLLESFLGCRPMLMLQECGNAMMNVIETLLCELLRIRNDLRRVLGALFRKRETTKHV